MASVRTFLQAVNQLKSEWEHVMMVGHNPIITYLGEYLSDEIVGDLPTGAVIVWSMALISVAAGFLIPKFNHPAR
jgi:phosphohistidine phosphatase SixA